MARRPLALGRPRRPGTAAALVVLALCLGPLAPLLARGGSWSWGGADWAALRFTLGQAAASAVLSVALAIPVARALARRRFRGRGLVVALLGAPFLMPTIVAVLGLLAVFGRGGLVNDALGLAGVGPVSIYGAGGVVLAHVALNLPLATRLLLEGWLAIPAERFRLAASLGAPIGPLLERPMLRALVPGLLAVIFALCLTSFAVALTLGGGPRATTMELAIYQALRFEADFAGAARLALVQYGLCATAALAAAALALPSGFGAGLGRSVERWDGGSRGLDAVAIGVAALLALLPLVMVAARGLPALASLPDGTGPAVLRSLAVAGGSAALCAGLALALALRGGRLATLAASLPLAASGIVLGAGLLLAVRPFVALDTAALPLASVTGGVLALPFAARALMPAVDEAEARHGRLAASLGIGGWVRLRIVTLPASRRAMGFGAGIAAALSMGDLGVVSLFASRSETLPLLMMRLMGAYRMEAAAGVALLLFAFSLGLFWCLDRWGRHGTEA